MRRKIDDFDTVFSAEELALLRSIDGEAPWQTSMPRTLPPKPIAVKPIVVTPLAPISKPAAAPSRLTAASIPVLSSVMIQIQPAGVNQYTCSGKLEPNSPPPSPLDSFYSLAELCRILLNTNDIEIFVNPERVRSIKNNQSLKAANHLFLHLCCLYFNIPQAWLCQTSKISRRTIEYYLEGEGFKKKLPPVYAEQILTAFSAICDDANNTPQIISRPISKLDAVQIAANVTGISVADIQGARRPQKVFRARIIAGLLLRDILNMPLQDIGSFLNRKHCAIFHLLETATKLAKSDKDFARQLATARAACLDSAVIITLDPSLRYLAQRQK